MNFYSYIRKTPTEFQTEYINTGLVDIASHDTFPLDLYTYGRKTVHENLWDGVTSKCRGIIVHRETGEIVARPFEKFHNFGSTVESARCWYGSEGRACYLGEDGRVYVHAIRLGRPKLHRVQRLVPQPACEVGNERIQPGYRKDWLYEDGGSFREG